MQLIRPTTLAAAAAVGLFCSQAFAAKTVNPPAPTPSMQASADATASSDKPRIVVTVRKIYYFDKLDRNHNGMLSRAELPADMGALRRNFVNADFDQNGQLTPEEYVLYSRGLAPQYIGVYHAYVYVYARNGQAVERIRTDTPL